LQGGVIKRLKSGTDKPAFGSHPKGAVDVPPPRPFMPTAAPRTGRKPGKSSKASPAASRCTPSSTVTPRRPLTMSVSPAVATPASGSRSPRAIMTGCSKSFRRLSRRPLRHARVHCSARHQCFFALHIAGRGRWFHGYCDLSDRQSIDWMRTAIVERESRADRTMTRREKLDHIWSTATNDFRAYADGRFRPTSAGVRSCSSTAPIRARSGSCWTISTMRRSPQNCRSSCVMPRNLRSPEPPF
jgi:hypothetical protein